MTDVGPLRVIVVPDGTMWFAQSLEVDYAAQGRTVAEVKENFEYGLRATVIENVKARSDVSGMLRVSPQGVWVEFFAMIRVEASFVEEQVPLDADPLPFKTIRYFSPKPN